MTPAPERTYLYRIIGPGTTDGSYLVGTPALVTGLVDYWYPGATAVPMKEVNR